MGSENAHRCAQNAENGFGFDFLEQYHKDGDEFISHIVRVTGAETWILFVNVETKDGNCFMGQERKRVVMVEFMQLGTTVTSEAYCETLKKLRHPV
jgi:hypothetical protein